MQCGGIASEQDYLQLTAEWLKLTAQTQNFYFGFGILRAAKDPDGKNHNPKVYFQSTFLTA